MIHWVTDNLGTAPMKGMVPEPGLEIIDVRDLIDKSGNAHSLIKKKIDEAVAFLKEGRRVVVCCDYGMSRSNAMAVGILAVLECLSFNDAVRKVIAETNSGAIKVEVLSAVRDAISTSTDVTHQVIEEKRILVTGGTGFLGSDLSDKLKAGRIPVFAPTRLELDLMNGPAELDLFVRERNINVIAHLANPRIYVDNSAMGGTLVMLKNMLDVCVQNEIILIYPSGWEVYSGYRANGLLASENLPLLPEGVYGETKYLCEQLLETFRQRHTLRCVLIRFSPIYGPRGDKPKFIFDFIDKAVHNKDIIAHRYLNGYPYLDLLNIDDATDVLMAIIDRGFVGTINVGAGQGVSTTEIAELIVQMTGSSSSILHRDIEKCAPNIVMDTKLAQTALEWRARIGIREGLQGLLDSKLSEYE